MPIDASPVQPLPSRVAIVRAMAGTGDLRLGALGQVSLHVRDTTRAERFYGETLGLRHLYTFGDLAFFDLDGTRLYLHRNDEVDWRPGSILYFRVDDIHAAWDELVRRDVERLDGPQVVFVHDSGIEEWMAFFADGEGNTLALIEQRPP
jgi:catechol 2,3-dioxygenase-like lactoylglutathione lyase family enzyme